MNCLYHLLITLVLRIPIIISSKLYHNFTKSIVNFFKIPIINTTITLVQIQVQYIDF